MVGFCILQTNISGEKMKTKLFSLISILVLVIFICTAATCDMCRTNLKTIDTVSSLQESQPVASSLEVSQTDVINPAIKITDVFWNSNSGTIEVILSGFSSWGDWKMYVDGKEIPMEGGNGKPVVRPNAELSNNPTGLIIGTEPWVTGLSNVDFPVCGTLQFDIPGKGLTNLYQFNLTGTGCKTASTKNCQVVAEQEVSTQSTGSSSSSKSTGTESTKEGSKTNTTTTDSNTKQGITADIRATDIYPDNQPKGIIFARITNDGPGILSGNKVTVTVSGTEKDIAAAATGSFITQPKQYLLTLKPGETQIINLEVDIDTSKYSYNFTITVAPVDFTDTNSSNNSYTEKVESAQSQQQVSPQSAGADIVITDLYPKDVVWSIGELLIKVTNNGTDAIENKKITITISGSQEDPLGNKADFILIMEKFWVDGKDGTTISLKPGETKVIYPKKDDGGALFFFHNYEYRYNFNLTINAVDFKDANENNNTYTKAIGKDKVVFSVINNTGAELEFIDNISIHIYPTGQKDKGFNFLSNVPSDYGKSFKTGQTLYRLLDPGIYDMEILWSGYAGGPFKMYSQYGVNITGNYNWVLDKAVVVLQAPQDYPIWGFFIVPYSSSDWINGLRNAKDLLTEIIPRWGYGVVQVPPGKWCWRATTSNNAEYCAFFGRDLYGFDYIRIPEPGEMGNPNTRLNP